MPAGGSSFWGELSNNLFYNVTNTGTVGAILAANGGATVWAHNNVFYEVGDSDYAVQVASNVNFDNNIIVAATRYGLTNSSPDAEYNMEYGASVQGFTGTSVASNVTNDPKFTDAAGHDLSLDAGFSPAIDAGNPLSGYDDIDGTRNDLGAFGGSFGAWTP